MKELAFTLSGVSASAEMSYILLDRADLSEFWHAYTKTIWLVNITNLTEKLKVFNIKIKKTETDVTINSS